MGENYNTKMSPKNREIVEENQNESDEKKYDKQIIMIIILIFYQLGSLNWIMKMTPKNRVFLPNFVRKKKKNNLKLL